MLDLRVMSFNILAASYDQGYAAADPREVAEIIRSTAELGPATERIAEELNNQYVIGYTPAKRGDGKYHTIRVSECASTPRPKSSWS